MTRALGVLVESGDYVGQDAIIITVKAKRDVTIAPFFDEMSSLRGSD